MPRYPERPANELARGTAKTDDIERIRRDATAADPSDARLIRKLDEVETTTASIREEVSRLKGELEAKDRSRSASRVAE